MHISNAREARIHTHIRVATLDNDLFSGLSPAKKSTTVDKFNTSLSAHMQSGAHEGRRTKKTKKQTNKQTNKQKTAVQNCHRPCFCE